VPPEHEHEDVRFFKDGVALRKALVEVYDQLKPQVVREGTTGDPFTSIRTAVGWSVREHGLDLHQALAQLDAIGAAPSDVSTSLDRHRDDGFTSAGELYLHADWQGLEGFTLTVQYEGPDESDVLAFGATIKRTMSRFGRADPYEPFTLDLGVTSHWWDSQWLAALVGAVAGSFVTYFLPKLFG
jgi:hypothetical protein